MPEDRSTERNEKNKGKYSGENNTKMARQEDAWTIPRNLDEKLVDIEQSYRRLKSGDIKGETESTIVSAQDQAICTNYFKNIILEQETESKCRLCKQHEESIEHLTSGCIILAKNEYLMRHDKVCIYLYFSICKVLGIETTDKWYTHMHKPVCDEGDVTLLCNKQYIQTEKLQQIGQIE